ncbi:MAG: tetratricopeptide repeat protein [Candidatus Eisenbacteria bacterium]
MFRALRPLWLALALGLALAPAVSAQTKGEQVFSNEETCRRTYQEGVQYRNNQQLKDAAARFSEVKEACPEMIHAYLSLGEIQVSLRQFQEAFDTYRDALDQEPGNLDVKEHLAFALSSAGEFDEALGLYLELRAVLPEKPEILRNLAFVYQQKGLIAEAIMLYTKLVEMDEANANTVSDAGRTALANHLYLPAVTFYKKLYEYNPNDASTLHILGGYYFQIGFYAEALFYYDKLLEQELPEDRTVSYHKYRAYCRNKEKQYIGAAEDYEYLIAKEPGEVSHHCNLAFAYRDGGQFNKAMAAIRSSLEQSPQAGCLYYAWGVTLLGQGREFEGQKRYPDAIGAYNEAKPKFEKVMALGDRNYAEASGKQIEAIDQLIERAEKLMEKESQNR